MTVPALPDATDFFCVIEQSADVETTEPNAVMLSLLWGTTVIAMETVKRRTNTPLDVFGLAIENPGKFAIDCDDDGTAIIRLPSGDVAPAGTRVTFAITHDDARLTVVAEPIAHTRRDLSSLLPDSRMAILALAVLFVFPIVSSLLALVRAPMTEANADDAWEKLQFVRTALAAADARERHYDDAENPGDEKNGATATSGGTGTRDHGEEGAKGDVATMKEGARYRVETHALAPAQVETEIEQANVFGMITLLSKDDRTSHATSAFEKIEVKGTNGALAGDAWGDSFGAGSSGLSGVGEGGGGKGAGVGLSNIGGLGYGAGGGSGGTFGPSAGNFGSCDENCQGSGQGFGKAGGHMREHRVSYSYRFDEGGLRIGGRLPPEAIQRVVRQNFGRLRACYEEGLVRNPSLEGRVAVKFVIDRAGEVSVAQDAGDSGIGDQKVINCIVAQYMRMTFPQPEGGVVTVVYPVIFEKG